MLRLAITKIQLHNRLFTAYIVLDEKREFVDFQLFDEDNSKLNQIYVGRVEHIVSNINAAFVSIDNETNAYLSLEDLKSPVYAKKQSQKKALSQGDLLLVQVIKDAVKTKNPVLTSKLSLQGKYAILTTDNLSLSTSKKLAPELAFSLREELACLCSDHELEGYGILLRTQVQYATQDEWQNDVNNLREQYLLLKENGIHKEAHSILYKNKPGFIQRLKTMDFSLYDGIYTDNELLYSQIAEELPESAKHLLSLYQDSKISLSTLYHIQGNFEKLLNKRIWLKSGANIIIEQLETLTFIDVNTAKNMKNASNHIYDVNLEAAREIFRQIRLRNISGMIVIDFINMSEKKDVDNLVEEVKKLAKQDVTQCQYMDITRLGLMEFTRKKVYRSLKEIIE